MICTPALHNLQTRRKKLKEWLATEKEVSVNVKSKNTLNYTYFPDFLLCPKNA